MKRHTSIFAGLVVLAAPVITSCQRESKHPAKDETSAVSVVPDSPAQAVVTDNTTDVLVFGDAASEQAHKLAGEHKEAIQGGLGESAVKLLPLNPPSHDGGSISFTMEIDPENQNYVSVRLWGGDTSKSRGTMLLLFADGKQVGYRRESDHDPLSRTEEDPQLPGRFFYETHPLPLSMTKGRTSIDLKIQALGFIYNYATTWEKYQHKLEEPSRGIYRVYTHTNPRLAPPAGEKQGVAPEAAKRSTPGPEVIEQSKQVVISRIDKMLQSKSRLDVDLLAHAYRVEWTPAFKDPVALDLIVRGADEIADKFASSSKYDGGWLGAAALGGAIDLTWPDIGKHLDEPFGAKFPGKTRREVWTKALRQSVDFWRQNRRVFTNQAMLVDMGIYRSNRGLIRINPSQALPEEKALRYVHEAVGIEPWMDSDIVDAKGERPSKIFGDDYRLITRKGLSRELGWVGSYGETILTITRELYDATGDELVRQQLGKLQRARLNFRYPSIDDQGNYGLRLSAEIDNRHSHFPQHGMAYAAPESIREHWGLETAAVLTDDPVVLGANQRFIRDGHYFDHIASRLKDPNTLAMMRNIEDYEKVKDLPKVDYTFPMEDAHGDFVFADEEDAVVALKHGDTRLFINFYFRAENAVNSLAKILELTPITSRIVTAMSHTEVIESGETYTRPDDIDWIRGDARHRTPPGPKIHQAWAGEKLPISARPAGASQPKYGDWGPFVGKAAFYHLQYGDYLIGLNTTETDTYDLPVPDRGASYTDLVTGKSARPENGVVKVAPLTTVILHTGKGK